MKLAVTLIVLGGIFLTDGGIRLALSGPPGLSGLIFAIPCLYFGIKRLRRR